jgi:hypothetical protein
MTGSAGSTGSLLSTAARAALLLAIACGAGRCGSAPASIDLVAALPTAERRALAPPDTAIHATVVSRDGAGQPALVTDAPARVIFPVNMPARARFRTAVSLQSPPGTGVTIRMGIADSRLYEELLRLSLEPPAAGADPWRTIDVDLGAYSGWQWSLFYHPSRITWKLVLNADATPGGSVVWLRPTIDMRR